MSRRAAVIGGGPAGLMAAEVLAQGGVAVDVYDAMPSVGRKFLMAGRGGLNITHSEPMETFLSRYGVRRAEIAGLLKDFGPAQVRDWIHGLGIETFVGTSGRVFPAEMKAAPLLRAWLKRLRDSGVRFHMRYRWLGWDGGKLRFQTPAGETFIQADATVLALGGGSWARLGSDAAWVPILETCGAEVAALKPANCGFDASWSAHFREKFAGVPVKPVALSFAGERRQGEMMISAGGVEGGLVYAFSAAIRDAIAREGRATVVLDLMPGKDEDRVTAEITKPRGSNSMANHLRKHAGITGVKAGLLRELLSKDDFAAPTRLAAAVKSLPLALTAPRPMDEAISTAGGVTFESLDDRLMLRNAPGVFCAGEMLDWEAPTGGYLLSACLASGYHAGQGALTWIGAL